jgi:hypothetical protein
MRELARPALFVSSLATGLNQSSIRRSCRLAGRNRPAIQCLWPRYDDFARAAVRTANGVPAPGFMASLGISLEPGRCGGARRASAGVGVRASSCSPTFKLM